MRNMKELNLKELEKVSGGYVVDNGTGDKFWIVLQDGTVKGFAPTEAQAKDYSRAFGASTAVLTHEDYTQKFGRDLTW